MTIQEQIGQLNDTLKKLHNDFLRIDDENKILNKKYDLLRESIKDKYIDKRNVVLQEQEDVLKYYRIAKDNSNKEILRNGVRPQKPDLAKLNKMIEQVNSYSRTDFVAGQIIDLCSAYYEYLEIEKKKIDSEEIIDLQNIEKNRNNEKSCLVRKKGDILKDCEEYLRGKDIKNLAFLFERIHSEYEITAEYFDNWEVATKRKKMMLLGYSQCYVDVPKKLNSVLKESFGEYFDITTKKINCPCGFTTDSSEEIFIEYTDLNASQMKSGIQVLILNFLRYFKPKEYKITLLDYIYYNAEVLGTLSVFTSMRDGLIDNVPTNEKELKQSIFLLANYYRKVEEKIGVQNVYDYNRTRNSHERIPYRILIINKTQESFSSLEESEMLYIINNAEKFGIVLIRMTRSMDGGSKGKDREKKYLAKASDFVRIISDEKGKYYIENDVEWLAFKWPMMPSCIPDDFIQKVKNAVKPAELGTKYFNRYKPQLPVRSHGKRKPIKIPFAINEDDKVVECSFENELFAAYMMGAARAGKSTLLHTMISSLIMNYHPDELELWLLDFKMLEFKQYVNYTPPHVKYVLLEKSEDLVFDIIDRLEEMLTEREYIFSQHGWQKLADVSSNIYMPAVFVIIDEFAQMSQILRETKGTGYGTDYTIKLTNLLQKGGAMGFKFIFASQTYTDGVEGLTEPARKQIQQRFALKNTYHEIKDTLDLSSNMITAALDKEMNILPPYESLFKWRTDSGQIKVERLRNMYTETTERDSLFRLITENMYVAVNKSSNDDKAYVDKHPILIDGGAPKTFDSQMRYYKRYETPEVLEELDNDDILIYPGVPCSFNLARPFMLVNGTAENILIVGGNRENELSVALSIFSSYNRVKFEIEIWTNERNSIYRKYKNIVLNEYETITDLDEICYRITEIKKNIQNRYYKNRIIMVLGYEMMMSDMELMSDEIGKVEETEEFVFSDMEPPEDLSQVLERIKACDNPEERKRIKDDYNARVAEYESRRSSLNSVKDGHGIYDARDDMEWIVKRASAYGIHFLFCFERAKDFIDTKIDGRAFRHKLAFAMSREDSIEIMGNRKANEIGEGICLYSNGRDTFSMRPHLYRGVPCNGWRIDDEGNIVQRRI